MLFCKTTVLIFLICPNFKIPTHFSLKDVLVWQNKTTGKAIMETREEWADKYHPMWQQFREKTERELGAYIHHKWGWKQTIDPTRNLSKFSEQCKQESNQEQQQENNKKVVKNPTKIEVNLSEPSVDTKDIFKSALKRFDEDSNKVNSQEGISKNEKHSLTERRQNLAGCRFCNNLCHCSPGRHLKRPYSVVSDKKVIDPLVTHEKQLRYEDLDSEIRDVLNKQMFEAKSFKGGGNKAKKVQMGYYENAAMHCMDSNTEVFEMLSFYRKSDNDHPNFTREQVRELLSVEKTQDKYRFIYKSPYGGEGHSDSENDSDDDNEAEEDDDDDEDIWNSETLQNY